MIANSDGQRQKYKPTAEIVYGENFADNVYHQVNVEVSEVSKLYAYTFPQGKSLESKVDSIAFDLQFDLDEVAYFAGVPPTEELKTRGILLSEQNFAGCMNMISWNEEKISISSLLEGARSPFLFVGTALPRCILEEPTYVTSFLSSDSNLKVKKGFGRGSFSISFGFRTFINDGVLLSSVPFGYGTAFLLALQNDTLTLKLNISHAMQIILIHRKNNIDDGRWVNVDLKVNSTSIRFAADDSDIFYKFNQTVHLDFSGPLLIGGRFKHQSGFIGCLKNVYLGSSSSLITAFIRPTLNPSSYRIGTCSLHDLCFPRRPCKNFGRCYQTSNKWFCDCRGTGFNGLRCEKNIRTFHKRSCSEYYTAGYRYNGLYTIKIGSSEPLKVFCDMNNSNGPITRVETTLKNSTFVFTGENFGSNYYYHPISYKASHAQIRGLVEISGKCRQWIRYNCYQSTLLDSKGNKKIPSKYGVRWYTQQGTLRTHWGGASSNSSSCACGLTQTCTEKNLLCNCDKMSPQFQHDQGYLYQKEDLPVSRIRISFQRTNHRSSFQLGPLECYDVNLKEPVPTNATHQIVTNKSLKQKRIFNSSKSISEYFSSPIKIMIPISNANLQVSLGDISHVTLHKNSENTQATTSPAGTRSFVTKDINEVKTTSAGIKKKKYSIQSNIYLYLAISGGVLLVSVLVILIVCRRRISNCVSSDQKRQPVVVFADSYYTTKNNNHKENLPLNQQEMFFPADDSYDRITGINSEDSGSSVDTSRYFDGDDLSTESNGSKSTNYASMPKRGILKLTKDSYKKSDTEYAEPNRLCIPIESPQNIDPLVSRCAFYNEDSIALFNYQMTNFQEPSLIANRKDRTMIVTGNVTPPATDSYLHQDAESFSSDTVISPCACQRTLDADFFKSKSQSKEANILEVDCNTIFHDQQWPPVRPERHSLKKKKEAQQRLVRFSVTDGDESQKIIKKNPDILTSKISRSDVERDLTLSSAQNADSIISKALTLV